MTRISVFTRFGVCLLLGAGLAWGQDDTTTYIFGEYYRCDQNREAFADVLVERILAPVYQKHVEEGRLSGWGWLGHHAGSSWRRLLFYTATDLDTLLATRDQIIDQLQGEMAAESQELISICPDHDDLIWGSVAGPPPAEMLQNLGPVSYSTYYVCDHSRQERADEIVKTLLAPAIQKQVEAGRISSWGWYAHVIGGQYRRLMTHSGASHAALLDAVTAYNDAAGEVDEAMANEFTQICSSHVDYLWNRVLPKPADGN